MEQKIAKRAEKLRKTIDDYRYRYHVLDDPKITDSVYDSLMEELRKLEARFPQLKTADSPTQRVGGKPLEKFQKVRHKNRQWSLDDAFSFKEVKDWEQRNERILAKKDLPAHIFKGKIEGYAVELKIDGLKIILDYEKGLLKRGATRGDGVIGEDVTANVKTIQSIPLRLKKPLSINVTGECWLSNSELRRINLERSKKGLPEFANSRNAAAGSIRQLDPKIAASRKLDSFAYDLAEDLSESQTGEQIKELKFLQELGFKVEKHFSYCRKIEQVEAIYKQWIKNRNKQEFGIDGLVVKINSKEIQKILGHTGKSPRYAIAFKFPAEQTTTRIKDIKVQVGRTGALTPVAVLHPVKVAGSTVSRATLHNEDEIKKKDIRIGDTVVIQKAGDVIPEVVEVIKSLRTGKERSFLMPPRCPICGGAVRREEVLDKKKGQSAAHYCSNPECFAVEKEKIIHFVSKKGFNIDGLGEKIVEQLINEGLVNSPADIFSLTKGDLEPLKRFAEKSAENLITSIEKSKNVELEKLIYALGIRHVGEENSILLSGMIRKNKNKIRTPKEVGDYFENLQIEELDKIEGFGEKVVQSIQSWFNSKKSRKLLTELTKRNIRVRGLETKKEAVAVQVLEGKSVVLTGSLEKLTREQAKDLIRRAGGKPSSSVGAKTAFVLVGNNPGSKLEKAKKFSIKTMNEMEFIKFLGI